MDAPPARARQVVDTTITKVIVALANRGDSSVSIIAWTVRGEHVIWIEEDMATHERAVKCSPVYYKNDAVKVTEQIFGEENEDESNELSQVEQNQINQGEQFQEQLAQEQAQQNIQQPVADPTQAQPQVDAQAQQQAATQPATDMTQVSNPPATDMSQAPDSMMASPVDQQPTGQQGIAGW
jgi:FtsZ-interacting cell division protein ZipA